MTDDFSASIEERTIKNVTITMPYEAAKQLKFLLGSIGGYSERGSFRAQTATPLFKALHGAGVDSPYDKYPNREELEEMRAKFIGLYCEPLQSQDN